MHLCKYNPQLISHVWAYGFVQKLGGRENEEGLSALKYLFKSTRAHDVDFASLGFKRLWVRERETIDKIWYFIQNLKPCVKDKVIQALPELKLEL